MNERIRSKKALIEKLRAGSKLVHQHLKPNFFVEGVGSVDHGVVHILEKQGLLERVACGIFEGEDYQTFRVKI